MINNPANYPIEFTNEKGNVMVSARNKVRKSAIANLDRHMHDFDDVKVVTAEGVSIPAGVDAATGATIWAHYNVTINTKEPEAAPPPKQEKEKLF